ncbi:MscS Mechanosensitive ion channel [Roseobacter sp. CCS2]|nr:MscS Mechanosensitive ion channel [Roseobacter sp. CCS2]
MLVLLVAIASPATAQSCDIERWYCVDGLNDGLDTAPDTLDQTTPRAAIESLIFAARNDDRSAAAHLLNLNALPNDQQAVDGPKLIRQLETIIARKTIIDWNNIVDRPDGLDARGPSEDRMAGQARKSILLWTLELEDHPTAIRLNRVKPGENDAVWVFAPQTVADIPALYERYGPSPLERWLPDALKQNAIFGLMWWEVAGLPILLLVSALIGYLVWNSLGALSQKAKRRISRNVLNAVRGPAATGASTGFALYVGANLFVFSGQITTWLAPVAWIGLMASGLWLVVNAVEAILDQLVDLEDTDLTQRQEEHTRTVATRIAAARRAFIVIVVFIGGGVFLSQTSIFQNLGLTLLGTAGALTLVLGFAARRVLGNIMASLQIALNGSAKIGDRIVYKDYLCHVERINFTYVQLRDWDGTRLVVPVEEFVSTPFENWTMKEPAMKRIIKIKCAHEADIEALRRIFNDVIEELDQDELGDLDNVKVRVADQDVFGKDVWFALPCADPNTSWDVACIARERIIAKGAKLANDRKTPIFPDAQPAEAA